MLTAPEDEPKKGCPPSAATNTQVLAHVQSPFQKIEILRHPIFGHQLILDDDLQISESDAAYGSAMVAPLLQLSSIRRVVILGGGDGGVLQELLTRADSNPVFEQDFEATMVDIDGEVMRLCREHLPILCGEAMEDERADVIVGDAFAYIEAQEGLDAVIYDLTMDPVREGQGRVEFIQDILDKIVRSLRPGGVFSMQACGHGSSDARDRAAREELLDEIRDAVASRFENVFEQAVYVPSYEDLWTFVMARKPL